MVASANKVRTKSISVELSDWGINNVTIKLRTAKILRSNFWKQHPKIYDLILK